VSEEARTNPDCERDNIAAYLDGELSAPASARFEQHIRACPSCAAELNEQRRLLRALDMALEHGRGLPLPEDFARVVAARAQLDMRGVRAATERRRALRWCAWLFAACLLLFGAIAGQMLMMAVRSTAAPAQSLVNLALHTSAEAGTSASVIIRACGRHIAAHDHFPQILALLLIAAISLPLMIVGYRRLSGDKR
jgi:anti-sigma factor RsiW